MNIVLKGDVHAGNRRVEGNFTEYVHVLVKYKYLLQASMY